LTRQRFCKMISQLKFIPIYCLSQCMIKN